ncbi:MAG: transposase, partial [Firmicutes bacterium]|nr:transposase [Bacillota bacterium]
MFRTIINNSLAGDKKSNVGRPAFDYIFLFKIIVLQKIYNLSDDATEYQINDRLSFMRFLGLGISSNIPDSKTIWKFKNDLKNANVMKELFNLFNTLLEEKHIITHEGTIVDATFVDVPRQRNTRKENAAIKEGKVPEEWINE